MASIEPGPRTPVALLRGPTADLIDCRLTHIVRDPINPDLARRQHSAYARILSESGYTVEYLLEMEGHPDAVFVEDMAVVLPEVAVVTRSGAEGRRPEALSVRHWLEAWHPNVVETGRPATLDGGDVLVIGGNIHVGRSSRTNRDGVEGLRNATEPQGYTVAPVEVGDGALHLKTAATYLGEGTLLANPRWIDPRRFQGVDRVIEIPRSEPFAANAVRLPGAVLVAEGHPRTADLLEREGFHVRQVDISEFAKAEAGVSCLSILCGPH